MKCPNCDCDLPEDALKCIICGATVQTKEEYQEKIRKKSEAEKLKKEQAGNNAKSGEAKADPTKADPPHKRRVPLPVILLAGVIAAAMIGSGIIKSGITTEPDSEERTEAEAQAGKGGEQDIQADHPQGTGSDQDSGEDGQAPGETQTASGKMQETEALSDPATESKGADAQQENAETQTVVEDQPQEPGRIMGWVVDADTGEAVKEARVILTDKQGKIYPDNDVLKTDDNGSFSVELPTGKYALSITKKDYLENAETKSVEIRSNEITKLTSIALRQDPAVQKVTEYYILPFSNSRYLTDADLDPLSEWELKLARNEIYARHGRRFKDSQLQEYFDQQSWYNGIYDPDDFDKYHGSDISSLEKKNAEYILKYEKDHGYFT